MSFMQINVRLQACCDKLPIRAQLGQFRLHCQVAGADPNSEGPCAVEHGTEQFFTDAGSVHTTVAPQPPFSILHPPPSSQVSLSISLAIRMAQIRLEDTDPRIEYRPERAWDTDGTFHQASSRESQFYLLFRGEYLDNPIHFSDHAVGIPK